jgi:mRNA interferase HicA
VCDTSLVKGSEFLRKVSNLAKRKNFSYRFEPAKGKGSHGTVYFGSESTIVKDRKKELGFGLLRTMCKDLGIDPREL